MVTNEMRIKALSAYLEIDAENITTVRDESHEFGVIHGDYLVLTDEEADALVKERILEDVWAFKTEFLLPRLRINITNHNHGRLLKAFRKLQEELCEDANDVLRPMLKDEEQFVREAVSADGRGHFLSGYDGEENDSSADGVSFYIFRTN